MKSNRLILKGKAKILEENNCKYVQKSKKINYHNLNNYLRNRNFYNFPEILKEDDNVNMFEYVNDITIPKEQKFEDMIDLLASLHHKTSYFKEVRENKFKEVYDNIKSNITYNIKYNNDLYNKLFKKNYLSPAEYLYIKNFYKINASLMFCDNELDNWYDLVKNETKQRVTIVHNNLKLSHYLKSDKSVFISWEKYIIDTPIVDLINLYKNEYLSIDFSNILELYLNKFPLYEYEKKLFFIIISLPSKVTFELNEFNNTKNVRRILDYIFKTEKLTSPYYSKQEEK